MHQTASDPASAELTTAEIAKELHKCSKSLLYFIMRYCMIEEPKPDTTEWIPFELWPFQREVVFDLTASSKIAILKARQLGLTWLVVAYALWLMVFRPGSVVLIFSAGDTEAKNFLARLKGMYAHLPDWMQPATELDNDHVLHFTTGSRAISFTSSKKSGRSQTATLAIIDEADWLPYFSNTIAAVKPTIDNGGQLVMLSSPDKTRPNSPFKTLWRNGRSGAADYRSIFIPWFAHPNRSPEWYAQIVADAEHIDTVHQEYPASPIEALAGLSYNKRFAPDWLTAVSDFREPIHVRGAPAVPGLVIYDAPEPNRVYTIAADCSEGDVTSDPTPIVVFNDAWEEVATAYGIWEPAIQAQYLMSIAEFYSHHATDSGLGGGYSLSVIVPERNNHGHSVILAVKILLNSGGTMRKGISLYVNPFDKKPGWLSNIKYKPQSIDNAAEAFRENAVKLRTEANVLEIANIDASTLKAPEGDTDDRAMAVFIGIAALKWPSRYHKRLNPKNENNLLIPSGSTKQVLR